MARPFYCIVLILSPTRWLGWPVGRCGRLSAPPASKFTNLQLSTPSKMGKLLLLDAYSNLLQSQESALAGLGIAASNLVYS